MYGKTSSPHPIQPGELNFDLRVPAKVVFGWGKRSAIADVVAPLARRAWVVAGSRTLDAAGVPQEIERLLTAKGIEANRIMCRSREPETTDVDETVAAIRPHLKPGDCLVAVGGGSTIDLAKAVAEIIKARPDEPAAMFWLGDVLERQGKSADAVVVWKKSIALASMLPDAEINLIKAKACARISQCLLARNDGAGVLLISEDLDEVMLLSDRVGVMSRGRIVAEFDMPADRDAIGRAMVGHG